ncbi:MAG TPA: RNA methyltransferase [Bryobacteraceae bacterium]|nr:RNA methyltransferase [Bryobacteraceae bacterium]
MISLIHALTHDLRTDLTSPRALHLTSARNPLLREVRKAVVRGTLTDSGYCVAEGFHLLEEAVRSECQIGAVLASEPVRETVQRRVSGLRSIDVLGVPDELFREVSATETSQGVIALVRPRSWELAHVFRAQSLVTVLDGVQDPGNAGAIVRAAEAFGASGALFVKGTVSAYNPKAVRASAGSVFRLPLVAQVDTQLAIAALRQHRLDLYAAAADDGRTPSDIDLRRRCALIIGSEGHGISPALRQAATAVRIPMVQVESLNAAMAAGILLYEASRQRRQAS